MIHLADEDSRAGRVRPLHLGMAAKTEIRIPDDQHFGIDGAMRLVADPATLAQGRVLKHGGFGLFAVAGGASLVQLREGRSARRFQDVAAVRIVTLHAVHFAFEDGMMLREVELRLRFQVAVKTGLRLPARVEDEFSPPATDRDMPAGGTMTGFATLRAWQLDSVHAQPRMRAGGKAPGHGLVAFRANFVPHIIGAFDPLRRRDHLGGSGTGGQ